MSWTLHDAREFARHAAQWEALHRAAAGSPLLAAGFIAPLLAEYARGGELLACYESGGQVRAMAVLAPRGRAAWDTFQPAQAPLGAWLQMPGVAPQELMPSLLRKLPGFALALGLTQCDPQIVPRPADSACLHTLDYIETARITIAGSFDDYWNTRGKNLRANLKKQRARLEKEGVALRLETIVDPAAVAGAIADYGRLESSGWKGQRDTAVRADDGQGRFYRALLEGFCRRGHGRIYRYWFGDQVAAMDLCIGDGECIVILKTAYDESVAKGLSPALLMREEATRALFAEPGLARIEFYGRVMEWHLRWTDEVRTLYHVNCYRWPLLARLQRQARARRQAQAVQ